MRALGQHDLADDVAELHPAPVEDERDPLLVAAAAFGRVGDQVIPVAPEQAHQLVQRGEVAIDLLHGDEIEPGDDLGDVVEGFRQARPVAELVGIEVADVPGREQQRILAFVRADLGLEPSAQRQQPVEHAAFGDVVAPEADRRIARHAKLSYRSGSIRRDNRITVLQAQAAFSLAAMEHRHAPRLGPVIRVTANGAANAPGGATRRGAQWPPGQPRRGGDGAGRRASR